MMWLADNWRIVAATVALGAVFIAGWTVRGWKEAEALKSALEARDAAHIVQLQENAEIIEAAEDRKAKTRIVYRTIRSQADEVDDTCNHSPDFYRLWNEASRAATRPEAD